MTNEEELMTNDDQEPQELGPRRTWTPDIEMMARQLISDVRHSADDDEASNDAIGTFGVFQELAAAAGEELQPDDYQSLAILLAKMCVGREPLPSDEEPPQGT